jgi:TPR repeat protein
VSSACQSLRGRCNLRFAETSDVPGVREFDMRAFATILALSFAATAGPLEDGAALYERGDYATALRIVHPLADQGAVGAQFILGAMYLGGLGVPQDDLEAARWFRLAAEQGDLRAPSILGFMYLNGRGVQQNDVEAARWLHVGAEHGVARAQFLLSEMYKVGQGVPQDHVLAHMWSNLSAAQGERGAEFVRNSVEKLMSTEQIEEAQKLAREWKSATPLGSADGATSYPE